MLIWTGKDRVSARCKMSWYPIAVRSLVRRCGTISNAQSACRETDELGRRFPMSSVNSKDPLDAFEQLWWRAPFWDAAPICTDRLRLPQKDHHDFPGRVVFFDEPREFLQEGLGCQHLQPEIDSLFSR